MYSVFDPVRDTHAIARSSRQQTAVGRMHTKGVPVGDGRCAECRRSCVLRALREADSPRARRRPRAPLALSLSLPLSTMRVGCRHRLALYFTWGSTQSYRYLDWSSHSERLIQKKTNTKRRQQTNQPATRARATTTIQRIHTVQQNELLLVVLVVR